VLLRFLALCSLIACSPGNDGPRNCSQHALGDASQPMQLAGLTIDINGNAIALPNGGTLLLQRPPQGGYVVYAGVAATNLEACQVSVTAELLDPASGNPLSNLDGRMADLTVANGALYSPSNGYSMIPNIAACPDALGTFIAGKSATLRVDATDAAGKTGRLEMPVTVQCIQGDSACACTCGGTC
jgi:hypothetical protein